MAHPATVSCVVPTHDRPEMLTRAVRSILAQSRRPLEVIVVDDLSQQRVRDTVAALQDEAGPPVRYVAAKGQALGTAGSSRNIGAAHAVGDLLAFLDDDDTWQPEFLQHLVDTLTRAGADFAVSWVGYRKSDRTVPGLRITEGLRAGQCLCGAGLTGSNVVIHRVAFDRVGGFDPTLVVSNDNDLMVRLLDAGARYAVVPQDLVVRHSHDQGHLTTKSERRARGIERYYDRYRSRMSRGQRRVMRRLIHSARRGPDRPLPARAYHAAAQAALTSPRQARMMVVRRAQRMGDLFN